MMFILLGILKLHGGLTTMAKKAVDRERQRKNGTKLLVFVSFESQQIIIIYGNDVESFFFRRAVTIIVVIAVAVAIFQFMRMMTSICEITLFISCLHVNKPTQN